jgi:hypothetical protein
MRDFFCMLVQAFWFELADETGYTPPTAKASRPPTREGKIR